VADLEAAVEAVEAVAVSTLGRAKSLAAPCPWDECLDFMIEAPIKFLVYPLTLGTPPPI